MPEVTRFVAQDRFFNSPASLNHGVVFEVGADHGKVGSSHSFFFEHLLGWDTLLVEAHPLKFGLLSQRRPGAIRVPTALCPEFAEIDFAMNSVGSVAHGNNQEMAKALKESRVAKVPCVPIGMVMKAVGLKGVDLWILDVEGFEQQVLEGMDWEIPVKVIYVETVTSKAKQILESAGFKLHPKFPGQKSSDQVWYNEVHLGRAPVAGGSTFSCSGDLGA